MEISKQKSVLIRQFLGSVHTIWKMQFCKRKINKTTSKSPKTTTKTQVCGQGCCPTSVIILHNTGHSTTAIPPSPGHHTTVTSCTTDTHQHSCLPSSGQGMPMQLSLTHTTRDAHVAVIHSMQHRIYTTVTHPVQHRLYTQLSFMSHNTDTYTAVMHLTQYRMPSQLNPHNTKSTQLSCAPHKTGFPDNRHLALHKAECPHICQVSQSHTTQGSCGLGVGTHHVSSSLRSLPAEQLNWEERGQREKRFVQCIMFIICNHWGFS